MFDYLANVELSTTIAKTETFTAKVSDFPEAAVIAFIQYGFQRKFNDAVGGKLRGDDEYTAEMKVADAKAMIADYKAGKVTKRREGASGVTDEVRAARSIVRGLLDAASKAKLKAMEDKDQLAKLDELASKHSAAIADDVAALVKRWDDERKAKTKLAGKVTVSL